MTLILNLFILYHTSHSVKRLYSHYNKNEASLLQEMYFCSFIHFSIVLISRISYFENSVSNLSDWLWIATSGMYPTSWEALM